jgi:hypothetical protein
LVFCDARRVASRQRQPGGHVENVQVYGALLVGWIRRFRGVATKYLPNYLAWHLALDLARRRALARAALRWPLAAGGT